MPPKSGPLRPSASSPRRRQVQARAKVADVPVTGDATAKGKRQNPKQEGDRKSCLPGCSLLFKMIAWIAAALLLWAVGYGSYRFHHGPMCPDEVDLAKFPVQCAKGDKYLDGVDRHTRAVFGLMRTFNSPRGKVAENITIPTEWYGDREMLKLPFTQEVMAWDEDSPDPGFGSKAAAAMFNYLNMNTFHPLVDDSTEFASAQEGGDVMGAIANESLRPLELTPWSELRSDEAISQFAFAGLAAHRLEKIDNDNDGAVYKSDWTWLHGLELRPGHEAYGAAAYFDANATLRKIYWSHGGEIVRPGDPEWNHAKWAYKASVMVGATLRDHLVGLHFTSSANLAHSAVRYLNPGHPLRRLLKPHTYGTASINIVAISTLATEYCFLHRATAFTWQGILDGFELAHSTFEFEPMKEHLAENGMDAAPADIYPWGDDGVGFFDIVHRHVSRYVHLYYEDDASVHADAEAQAFWQGLFRTGGKNVVAAVSSRQRLSYVVAHQIFLVTGLHNHVGNVADYLRDPTFVSAKLRAGTEVADRQSSFQELNIALATAMPAPRLIADYTHLLLSDKHLSQTTAAFRDFQADLTAYAEVIQERNKHRRFPCASFDPKKMVSSVSI